MFCQQFRSNCQRDSLLAKGIQCSNCVFTHPGGPWRKSYTLQLFIHLTNAPHWVPAHAQPRLCPAAIDSNKFCFCQPSPWLVPGKPNLPLGLRGKAGGCARVTDKKGPIRDFPGGPAVNTLPSNARSVGTVPGWGQKNIYFCFIE